MVRAGADKLFRWMAEATAGVATLYHRAELLGAQHIPPGPALLVGNHGVYGFDTPVFFYLVIRATGRYPLGLADRGFFKIPFVRDCLKTLGGVEGTRDNAVRALERGNLVVCYPGGAREVFKNLKDRYRLRWEKSLGFAKVAARTGVPVIPFAGFGVDGTFAQPDPRALAVPLSPNPKYRVPLGVGLGPLPLPTRFRFAVGEALEPPRREATTEALLAFKERVAAKVQHLLVRACHG